ncbi:hypothetical protein EJ06DRAFT_282845 [Trichodelitschia bisporula]|uniref:Zn(2)-C6 fungal-type domain-containing protein n=1 Tax=Trichodelitschia bisporula TaxID=703511 RepID=A0A6G1I681_9PEZI|nr:hypothetical protein EJ06DRAFT_282845 [Trichodelitschia bisporula]
MLTMDSMETADDELFTPSSVPASATPAADGPSAPAWDPAPDPMQSESTSLDPRDSTQDNSPAHSPPLSPGGGEEQEESTAAQGAKPSAPIQKRRRVTRACDECRRKKIKCDGKQPCTHCTVYSYECTYDQPSNRRRNAAPQYIEALETQLKRANAIIKLLVPDADLGDHNLEAKLRQGLLRPHASLQQVQAPPPVAFPANPVAHASNGVPSNDTAAESHLESMVKSTGQLDLDEQGNLEYHGQSSGLSFVRRMKEQLGADFIVEGHATPFVKSRPLSQVFDSPRSTTDSPWDSAHPGSDLPPREKASLLCEIAVDDAAALLRIVHYPTFKASLDRLYDIPPESYTNDDNVFLPLAYACMALGTLFAKDEESELMKNGYEIAINEGFKYFKLSRQLMDIADVRDLRQLQAILFMILFLQSSAKLSTCYAYIGVALRSALRMGLHRSFPDPFNPIEAETRKRVFWVIRKMDTYVGALLGLPHSLSDDDIDQDYPAPVDDEFITADGIYDMPPGRVSVLAASNAHTDLVRILAKIVRYVYPTKGSPVGAPGKFKSYSVSYSQILEIEKDLQEWQDRLPMGLKPGGEAPLIIVRVQHLLRMSYAHAQMMLYRPFLHYVSQTCKSRVVDKRSYACAAACVSVSRNIVHIAVEMKKRGLLIGAYWFTMYTTFFAILSLVFYTLENPDNEASQSVLQVAKEGKETLEALAKRSMAADRCTATLSSLFKQLPERLHRTRQNSISGRKRRQEAVTFSQPEFGRTVTGLEGSASASGSGPPPPRRSSTFPEAAPTMGEFGKAYNAPVDLNQYSFPQAQVTQSFFDVAHPLHLSMHTTPTPTMSSATPALTHSTHDSNSFPASPAIPEPSFPLADLSAIMFPSADPFAYPNQSAPPAHTYDAILKSLGDDPTFPFPASLEALRGFQGRTGQAADVQGGFVPPSSAFMFRDGGRARGGEEERHGSAMGLDEDGDVQLLGPMPMYAMQGGSSNGPQVNGGPARGFQEHANGGQVQGNGGPNMNLDLLLGGEEWAGISGYAERYDAEVGPFRAKEGRVVKKEPREGITFDDLTPGALGWGLDGY